MKEQERQEYETNYLKDDLKKAEEKIIELQRNVHEGLSLLKMIEQEQPGLINKLIAKRFQQTEGYKKIIDSFLE